MNITNTLSALLLLSFVACSNNAKNEEDPHEEFNRDMVNFNLAVDDNVLRPAANVYKKASHNELPMSMHNFFTNLKEPYYCVNHLVCGNFEYSINSIFRLLVNSTLGILGFFDSAESLGLEKRETSFAEALRNIGMCHGDYFVMPILGPVFARDLVAEPISWFMDPVSYLIGIPWVIAKYGVYQINYRALDFEMIDSVKKSEDVYSTWKGMYTQKYGDQSKIDDSPSPDK